MPQAERVYNTLNNAITQIFRDETAFAVTCKEPTIGVKSH